MTMLDTSALVASLSGARRELPQLRRLVAAGERLALSALVMYEWRRGPRTESELADQERLFPAATVLPYGREEAQLSAELFRILPRARSRTVDIAIAASVLCQDAELWTLNPADFEDVPGLRLTLLR